MSSATAPAIQNRDLALPYFAPLLAYIALGVPDLAPEFAYTLRLVVVPGLLVWAWRWYVPVTGPNSSAASIAVGALAGLMGLAIWIALLAPFVAEPDPAAAWSGSAFWLRVVAAGAVVPVFEELVMRGYVLRLAFQWDAARRARAGDPLGQTLEANLGEVPPGAFSTAAVAISTAVFVFGHAPAEWPAATAYGLLMCALWITRRDLVSCMSAHAVTNIALAFYVRATDHWALW